MPRVLGYHQSRVHSKNRLSFRRVWARFGANGWGETPWTRFIACSRSGPLERLRATGTRWLAACKVLRWFSTLQGEDQGPFFGTSRRSALEWAAIPSGLRFLRRSIPNGIGQELAT